MVHRLSDETDLTIFVKYHSRRSQVLHAAHAAHEVRLRLNWEAAKQKRKIEVKRLLFPLFVSGND